MISALAIALALAAGPPNEGAPPPGTPIVAIRVVSYNVFDTSDKSTSSWPYRWADALHITTRESFVRSILLFKVGDRLDWAKLEESERLLRKIASMNPVTITAKPVEGGAEVVVETHDQWSTEVGLDYGKAGNRTHYGISLAEWNFLGLGKAVLADYRTDAEREYVTLSYRDPMFAGRRLSFEATHRYASDGSTDKLLFERPFFSLDTRWAAGSGWERLSEQEYLWAEGEKVVDGHARKHAFRAWAGWRLPGDGTVTNRLTAGVFADVAEFDSWQRRDGAPFETPEDRTLQGVQVSWERQTDRWKVVRGFQAWNAQEDVPLGPDWHLAAGLSLPAFGGDRQRLVLSGDVVAGWLRDSSYTWATGGASGRLEDGGLANGWAHGEVGASQIGSSGWRGRVAFDLGHDLDRDWQLPLGADTGLRGWNPATFDGTSRAVVNVEWRTRLTGEVLHLGIIGMNAFADAGRTWAPRVGPSTEGWREDAGVGLLVEITRATIVRLVRFEVGFPSDHSGPVLLISSSPLFFQPRRDWAR
jgi:hypothetical protein